MSVLSQFFPGGSAGEGFIDVETLILSGGGGGGQPGNPTISEGGGGGGGAVFYGFLSIKPGSTCPIVVGAAGNGSPAGGTPGTPGGSSSVRTPVGTYLVEGGGGGGCSPGPGTIGAKGLNGGCAGGSANIISDRAQLSPAPPAAGFAVLRASQSFYATGTDTSQINSTATAPFPPVTFNNFKTTDNWTHISTKNGVYMGYPSCGGYLIVSPSPSLAFRCGTGGGGAGGAAYAYGAGAPLGSIIGVGGVVDVAGRGYVSNITGITSSYGEGGTSGTYPSEAGGANTGQGAGGTNYGSPASFSGGSGVVILKYPTQFAAATISPAPAATDLSPSTPGFRTYKFISPGSITLP